MQQHRRLLFLETDGGAKQFQHKFQKRPAAVTQTDAAHVNHAETIFTVPYGFSHPEKMQYPTLLEIVKQTAGYSQQRYPRCLRAVLLHYMPPVLRQEIKSDRKAPSSDKFLSSLRPYHSPDPEWFSAAGLHPIPAL